MRFHCQSSFLFTIVAVVLLSSCGDDEAEESGPLGDLLEGVALNDFSLIPQGWITTEKDKYRTGSKLVLGSGDDIATFWKGKTVKVLRVESLDKVDKVFFEGVLEAVDQDVDLEFRQDQLWYFVGAKVPFTGVAFSYYPETRAKKSRTVIVKGQPKGVINEWNPDGSRKGGGFADDFEREK